MRIVICRQFFPAMTNAADSRRSNIEMFGSIDNRIEFLAGIKANHRLVESVVFAVVFASVCHIKAMRKFAVEMNNPIMFAFSQLLKT